MTFCFAEAALKGGVSDVLQLWTRAKSVRDSYQTIANVTKVLNSENPELNANVQA